jgi:hypothetical protein
VRRADNLTADSLESRQCGILDISQPYRTPMPVTGIALLLPIHSANCVETYTISCRRLFSSAPL